MVAGVALVLLRGVAGRDDRAWNIPAGVVRKLDRLPKHAARHGHGTPAEGLLLLVGQPVEVLLFLDVLPHERLLGTLEVRVQRTLPRRGVDVDHGGDALGYSVARGVAAEPARAVDDEHDRGVGGANRIDDRVDMV